MTVGVIQSNYIPWRGYFDIIGSVDLFIFHDDLQYTKGDWRNRNRIKTENGARWLTIPCGTDEKRLIHEVTLRDSAWQKQHWNLIRNSYSKAQFFDLYKELFQGVYLGKRWTNLSDLNQHLIKVVSKDILGLQAEFEDSRAFGLVKRKGERVIELLKKVGANAYLSGPAAKDYLDEKAFVDSRISLQWMDYSGYKEYRQLYPPFDNNVSIIDLIFNEGPRATQFLKSGAK